MQLGGACNNENKTAGMEWKYGPPKPGDQTGQEVAITGWLDCRLLSPKKPLKSVFRFKNPQYREDIAKAITFACENPNVGYSNTHRWTFEQQVASLPGGFQISNLAKVSVPCDTDCSMLVALCFKCVTGVNLGSTDTRHMQEAIRKTKLCTELKNFSEKTQATGYGLQIGDICVWRETNPDGSDGYSGHTAVVVTLDDSYVPSNKIYLDTGITNVVISANFGDNIQIFGQNSDYSIDNSNGPLKLSFYDEKLKKELPISKIIAVGSDLIPRMIYGFPEAKFEFSMIGDSRTMQLGENLLGTSGPDQYKQFSFISDNFIFAQKNLLLMQGKSIDTGILYINDVTELVKRAAKLNLECANFWLGINDVFKYKEYFLGNVREQGQTQEEAQDLFIEKWVNIYAQLINYYVTSYGLFNKQSNKVYLTSIVSTSKNYEKYFSGQGLLISKINSKLLEYVDSIQSDWEAQGYEKDTCWLQYVELNKKSDGSTYSDADQFVKSKEFSDGFHFISDWYKFKFIPNYNFSRFVGELDNDVEPEIVVNTVDEMPVQIYKYFKQKGYSKAFSVGLISNIYYESNLNPAAAGDNMKLPGMTTKDYTSFGICQWHNTSFSDGQQHGFGQEMKDWCSAHGGDWKTNLFGQLSWLLETMYTTSVSQRYFSPADIQSFQTMKIIQNNQNGAEKIAEMFVTHYEKPGNLNAEIAKRVSIAKTFWNKLSQE